MKRYFSYFISLLSLFATSCAQQSSPSGGAKDITPPKITESFPSNFSLNYSGNNIELKFDEFVQINNLKEQLVITPALKFTPTFQLSGKKLKITFIDSLQPNTTYQFNFGEGIKDITENNPLDSNLFVFSTGNYIDSLSIKGQVKDAFLLTPIEKALVMLYEELDDSIPLKERPVYFSKTDKSGFFDVQYLPVNVYKMVVIIDENANYIFDPLSEKVGFKNKLISSTDTLLHTFHLFQEEYKNQYIKTTSSDKYGKIMFVFNQPTNNPVANIIGKSFKKQWYISELNKQKDTLIYWITEPLDTLSFEMRDGQEIIDTVDVIMSPKPKDKLWNKKITPININTKKTGSLELFDSLVFKGTHPISAYNEKLILLVENEKDTIPIALKSTDTALRNYYFNYNWKEDASYALSIFPKAFVDVFGLQNDTIKTVFKTSTWNKYADVLLEIELPTQGSFVVQLFNASKKIVQENTLFENKKIRYKNLLPGKYQMRIIFDANNNGKWDTGNLLKKQQPEKIIYYSGVIEVRSGWDIDLTWKIER